MESGGNTKLKAVETASLVLFVIANVFFFNATAPDAPVGWAIGGFVVLTLAALGCVGAWQMSRSAE